MTILSLASPAARPALADPASTTSRLARPERTGAPGWQQIGEASYYSSRYNGRRTANGGRYNPGAMTAAHPFLPLGTRLRVLAEGTGRSVVVTVTDRQTANGRVLDLSRRAAEQLDIIRPGRARVRLIALSEADSDPLEDALPPVHRPPAASSRVSRHLHAHRKVAHLPHTAAGEARPHRLAHRTAHPHPMI
jgi:rare lipoprotein A